MSSVYNLIIPQIQFIGEFVVDANNIVVSLSGSIYPNSETSNSTGDAVNSTPVTLLPTQTFPQGPTYVPNDNIFNNDPNFTYNGLAFTTVSGTGILTYYTLYTGLNETDSTKMNYVDFGPDVTDLTNATVQASFIIRKKDHSPKLTISEAERINNESMGIVAYKIEVKEVLLNAILFVKDRVIVNIRGTVGNNAITLLNPGVYPSLDQPNDNKFYGNFTEFGMSFATSEGLAVDYYNLYSSKNRNFIFTGFDITGAVFNYEVVTVTADASGYYC